MKIYFAGSIRGGREDVVLYSKIIQHLRKYGEVLTEHVADPDLMENGERNLSDEEIHDRDMDWLKQSEVIVAEVSVPSLGVGYEIRAALEFNKKVLCLYRQNEKSRLSAMISGAGQAMIYKYNYLDEALEIVGKYFKDYP